MTPHGQRDRAVPGSCIEKLVAFLWYGVVLALWLGVKGFLAEFGRTIRAFNYEALPRRTEQTVVLTGATRGLGLEVLKKLLRLDYRVIIGVRDTSMGERVIDSIRRSGTASGTVKCFQLDLKSLESVTEFAKNVLRETERIDLLINNAGIMFQPYELTKDNYEVHFQVNYLSHFLLTKLLLPTIKLTGSKRSTNCRIVNVSSIAHTASYASDMEDLPNPKIYSAFRAYYDSKFCQVASSKYLNAQLEYEGAKVRVYTVHPGVIPTDLYLSLSILAKLVYFLKIFFRDKDAGSEVIMFTAISPWLEDKGGSYVTNLKCTAPNKLAEDLSLQKYLWDVSENCVDRTGQHDPTEQNPLTNHI